jgi:hypothetical protein
VVYRALADGLVLAHFAFVLFVVVGGLLVLRWPRVAWAHVPAVAWGVVVECSGWVCPLTPIEGWLRAEGGGVGYAGGFIEHYIMALLYPVELTRARQLEFGVVVAVVNGLVYWRFVRARVSAPRGEKESDTPACRSKPAS